MEILGLYITMTMLIGLVSYLNSKQKRETDNLSNEIFMMNLDILNKEEDNKRNRCKHDGEKTYKKFNVYGHVDHIIMHEVTCAQCGESLEDISDLEKMIIDSDKLIKKIKMQELKDKYRITW